MDKSRLSYIAAPMVNQSDLPFRLLVRKYGATLAYTQMLLPSKLLNDRDYLDFHQRDLSIASTLGELGNGTPVVVQLCGDDPEMIVSAGKKLQGYCDAIDLNLGCPQEAAREGHYGAYLLGPKDRKLVQDIVSDMSNSLTVPISVKLRLCNPAPSTIDLGLSLEACGASWVALHARTISARNRRKGAADLSVVKNLKEALTIPVVSNGNVRQWQDLQKNLEVTGADGVMVGETLLGNPCIFAGVNPDPFQISLEYLDLCRQYPETVTIPIVQSHIRHFVDFKLGRRPWYKKFRATIGECQTLDDIQAHIVGWMKTLKVYDNAGPADCDSNATRDGDDDDTADIDLTSLW
ncbi:hypothetical protein HGRIS_011516 [Hohenbuehelia grisea]|uniref:tRNA-dihydrouridine(16/17) synthase [NAD(P)(+)] n=1 Tax=Hohenbuehelia grisea TaxID=104357 RepID=A0ABR3JVB1_9AGAR